MRGQYFFLSNFAESPMTAPTLEHHYQAAKCINKEDAQIILNAKSPAEAKKLSRKMKIRPDFNKIKLQVMEDLLRKKFQDKNLAKKLKETENEEIVEGNWWNDTYWGICNGKGENHLGKLLMKIRDELRNQTA